MTEQPEIQTFTRSGEDGPEVFRFAPWPTGPDGQPAAIRMELVEVTPGGGDLRHLSYDDPPGTLTPEQYREGLAHAVGQYESLPEFAKALVMALGRDLVLSHGVQPQVAIAAVIEFAERVYEDLGGQG